MNQGVKAVIVVVCLGVAGFLLFRHFTQPSAFEQDAWRDSSFHCDECGHNFDLTAAAYKAAVTRDRAVSCVACSSYLVELAFQCLHCQEYFVPSSHGMMGDSCPRCGGKFEPD